MLGSRSLVSRLREATSDATGEPFSRQGVAYRSDHYRHCPLMDIYECTNQRQPLPGFNAIRIDYIDSGRRRNLPCVDRPCGPLLRAFEAAAGLSEASKESGISGKLLAKCNRGEQLEQLLFFANRSKRDEKRVRVSFFLFDVFTLRQIATENYLTNESYWRLLDIED